MDAHQVYNHFLTLKNRKESKCRTMRWVNYFFNPDDDTVVDFTGSGGSIRPPQQQAGELLDVTGSDILTESVTYVLGLFFDESKNWFLIEHEDYDPTHETNKILQKQADILWRLIGKTNYYQEMSLIDWDIYVHGHGLMIINSSKDNFASCRAKNPLNVFWNDNEYGEVKEVFWEESFTTLELAVKFKEEWEAIIKQYGLNQTLSGVSEHKLVTAYFPVEAPYFSDVEREKLKGKKWARRYYLGTAAFSNSATIQKKLPKVFGFSRFEGFKESSVFPTRDVPTRQHPYGKGEGRRALPKARILNNLMRSIIRTSKLKANPIKVVTPELAREMGILSKTSTKVFGYAECELKEGSTFIFDAARFESGNRPIELLEITGDIAPMYEVYRSQREQFAEMLPIAGSVYKVARQSIDEIQQRTEQQHKRLGPLRANYMQEGLTKHLKKFYDLAKRSGAFVDHPLPEGVDTSRFKFVFNSYLLQTNRLSGSVRLAQTLGVISNFLAIKPTMADYLDADKIIKSSFSSNGLFEFLLPEDTVRSQRELTAQQIQQQQAGQQAGLDAQALSASAKVMDVVLGRSDEGGLSGV